MGCANQAGEDNRNVARMAVILAGFPFSVPAVTVNRLCGSSLDAVNMAAREIMVGDAAVAIAGGVKSMSRSPWVVGKPDRAFAPGNRTAYDATLVDADEGPRRDGDSGRARGRRRRPKIVTWSRKNPHRNEPPNDKP